MSVRTLHRSGGPLAWTMTRPPGRVLFSLFGRRLLPVSVVARAHADTSPEFRRGLLAGQRELRLERPRFPQLSRAAAR